MKSFIEVSDKKHGGLKLLSVSDILHVEQQKDGSATIQLKGETRYFHVKDYFDISEQLT